MSADSLRSSSSMEVIISCLINCLDEHKYEPSILFVYLICVCLHVDCVLISVCLMWKWVCVI